MKVIKKNEVEEKSEYPKRVVCDHCGAELEYDKDDEFIGLWGIRAVRCPECDEQTWVGENREEPPVWAYTFDHTNKYSAKELECEEIQKMVSRCYEKLMSDDWSVGDHYLTQCGDTMVFGVKYEDEVNVYVTKDFWEDKTCL